MPNVKDDVIAMIQQMPDDTSVTDIMAELYFKYKVDKGLAELDKGEGIPYEVVRQHYRRLFEFNGISKDEFKQCLQNRMKDSD